METKLKPIGATSEATSEATILSIPDRERPENLPIVFGMACCGLYNELGYKGFLPWNRFERDMRDFLRLTNGRTMVMGRITFESIIERIKLGNRRILVVSRLDLGLPNVNSLSNFSKLPGEIAWTNDASLKSIQPIGPTVIAGGARLYAEHIDKMPFRLTRILRDFNWKADAHFPKFKCDYQDSTSYGYDPTMGPYSVSWLTPKCFELGSAGA